MLKILSFKLEINGSQWLPLGHEGCESQTTRRNSMIDDDNDDHTFLLMLATAVVVT